MLKESGGKKNIEWQVGKDMRKYNKLIVLKLTKDYIGVKMAFDVINIYQVDLGLKLGDSEEVSASTSEEDSKMAAE